MRVRRVISEMITSPLFSFFSFSGIRSSFRVIGNAFWPKYHPAAEGTVVNYDLCRQLYRNSGDNALGAGFAKPIVDLQVSFMGIPRVDTSDENMDDLLNECISEYWAPATSGDVQGVHPRLKGNCAVEEA